MHGHALFVEVKDGDDDVQTEFKPRRQLSKIR